VSPSGNIGMNGAPPRIGNGYRPPLRCAFVESTHPRGVGECRHAFADESAEPRERSSEWVSGSAGEGSRIRDP